MSIEEAVYIYSKMNDIREEEVYELVLEDVFSFLNEKKKLGCALQINNLMHQFKNEVLIPRLIDEERYEELSEMKKQEDKIIEEINKSIEEFLEKLNKKTKNDGRIKY